MAFCRNCGIQFAGGEKFCRACGAPVTPPTPEPMQQQGYQQQGYQQPGYQQPSSQQKPSTEFLAEYKAMWINAINFKDRTTVRGYWMAILYNMMITVPAAVLAQFIWILYVPYTIYTIAILLPSTAIVVRRLNDIGKDWKWVFVPLVPTIVSMISAPILIGMMAGNNAESGLTAILVFSVLIGLIGLGVSIGFIVLLCKPSIPPDHRNVV